MSPDVCPNCGAEVPRNARACPECGSDERTGWSDRAASDHLDLPEEEFDYDEFVKREFAPKKPMPHGIAWYWWVVAIGLLLAFVLPFILR